MLAPVEFPMFLASMRVIKSVTDSGGGRLKTSTDVLIVGGGIIGLMTARELLARGRKVTIVDKGPAGLEASHAAAGILSPLPPWAASTQIMRLTRLSLEIYPKLVEQLLAETSIDAEYWSCGLLYLEKAGEPWPREALPVGAKVLTPDEIHDLEPALTLPEGRHLLLPTVGQVNNRWLIEGLLESIGLRGGLILDNTEASDLLMDHGRIRGAKTSAGDIEADQTLLSTGAWADVLLAPLRISTGVHPMLGQMLSFQATPGLINRIVFEDDFYLVPRQDGTVLVGATLEDVGFNKETTQTVARELREFGTAFLPALRDLPILDHWCGLRPGNHRDLPYLGQVKPYHGLYLASGHYRLGITLAPGTARLMSQLMCGGDTSLPMDSFALADVA